MMNGLIIREPWIDLILDNKKPWEIRGSNTRVRGTIALIRSGTKTIVGLADLVSSRPLTVKEYEQAEALHGIPITHKKPYNRIFAWVLKDPRRLPRPVPYKHPQGAIIWVKVSEVDVHG